MDALLRDELIRRAVVDQEARRAPAPLFATDRPSGEPTPDEQVLLDRLAGIDRDNTRWLADRVAGSGWPLRSQVGEQAARDAWLLAQHADADPAFQRRCLDLMRAAPKGEVDPGHVAYLTDRVGLAAGEGQVYGTQMMVLDGRYEPRDLRDPDTVDARRAAVGLGPLEEYRRSLDDD